jgi:ribonuclease BN (tRNA processing enzyme)
MSPLLACFLSHIYSDHLAGLESLRSLFWYTGFASWIPPHANRPPSVYCSAVIREMLLRLERYPYRINYAKGILKARQQMYKHLHKVLVHR